MKITVVIPTLGKRLRLFDVLSQLETLNKSTWLSLEVFISLNYESSTRAYQERLANFIGQISLPVGIISPNQFKESAEEHLYWCLKWLHENQESNLGYIWVLTDQDTLILENLLKLFDFLEAHKPDFLFANNLWADPSGVSIPSVAFPSNALVWQGDSKQLFMSLGYEHATTTIGTFFIKKSFLDIETLETFDSALKRAPISSHSWWALEVSSKTQKFMFYSLPILINRMAPHHLDDAKTWKQFTEKSGRPTRWPWSIGYILHLEHLVGKAVLSYEEIANSIISEPQRGVLPFVDEILRNLKVQARLALIKKNERLDPSQIELITEFFSKINPLYSDLVQNLCIVLGDREIRTRERLVAWKLIQIYEDVRSGIGVFNNLFVCSYYGYSIYRHPMGLVALLGNSNIELAFRDLQPVDISPHLLYGGSVEELYKKVEVVVGSDNFHIKNEVFWRNKYPPVYLRNADRPLLSLPYIQLFLYSKPDKLLSITKRMIEPVRKLARYVKSFARIFLSK